MDTTFEQLLSEAKLLNNITKAGFTKATPIQEKTLPLILKGQDLAALAPTGTGKTGAFLLPLIERVFQSKENNSLGFSSWNLRNFILVIAPTRELADQIQTSFTLWSEGLNLKSALLLGGDSMEKQIQDLKANPEFIFATPGRLIDLYKEHYLDLKQVRALIFDEADRLFDMGFKDDMSYILQRVPRERQLLFFSATLNFETLETAYQFGSEPVEVSFTNPHIKAESIDDKILHVGQEDKAVFLLSLLLLHKPKQAIVFTNFKNQVELLASFLRKNNIPSLAISSLLSQPQRQKVMAQFRSEESTQVLVATDVAARGLDVTGVDLVINYELPQDAESYVHRIGRTGRAKETGQAFSLVSDRDIDSLQRIESYLKQTLHTVYLEDSDLVKDYTALHKIYVRQYDSKPLADNRSSHKSYQRGSKKNSPSSKNQSSTYKELDSRSRKKSNTGSQSFSSQSENGEPSQESRISPQTKISSPEGISSKRSSSRGTSGNKNSTGSSKKSPSGSTSRSAGSEAKFGSESSAGSGSGTQSSQKTFSPRRAQSRQQNQRKPLSGKQNTSKDQNNKSQSFFRQVTEAVGKWFSK
jgi:ATP-dependent RNA helicase RhlE